MTGLLEQEKTIATVLAEQLARARETIKKAERDYDGKCPWCHYDYIDGHDIECEAFTPSGIPR